MFPSENEIALSAARDRKDITRDQAGITGNAVKPATGERPEEPPGRSLWVGPRPGGRCPALRWGSPARGTRKAAATPRSSFSQVIPLSGRTLRPTAGIDPIDHDPCPNGQAELLAGSRSLCLGRTIRVGGYELLLGVFQVLQQKLLRTGAIAHFETVQDFVIARQIALVEPPRLGHDVEHQPQLSRQQVHQLLHALAAAQRNQGLMEPDVRGAKVFPVAVARGLVTDRDRFRDLVERPRLRRDPLDRGTFDDLAHAVDVDDV